MRVSSWPTCPRSFLGGSPAEMNGSAFPPGSRKSMLSVPLVRLGTLDPPVHVPARSHPTSRWLCTKPCIAQRMELLLSLRTLLRTPAAASADISRFPGRRRFAQPSDLVCRHRSPPSDRRVPVEIIQGVECPLEALHLPLERHHRRLHHSSDQPGKGRAALREVIILEGRRARGATRTGAAPCRALSRPC